MSAEGRWLEAWQQRDRLLRIARRRLPTREDAEDVVAEAIQRAGAANDLPVSAVPAWLTRVTINLCVDRQRRLATQRAAMRRAELRPEPEPTHEELVVARAEAAWLAGTVELLPPRQALAVRLRADGMGIAEIASLLNVSRASVDGLLKRSRAALREALRVAGALVLAGLAADSRGRRPAVVVLAATAVLVTLLPWTETPAAPNAAPSKAPAVQAGPSFGRAADAAATQVRQPRVAALTTPADASVPRVAAPRGVGRPVPYDGPRCLVAYCLPVVDEGVDAALGATSPRGWSPADLHDYLGDPTWSEAAAVRRPLVAIVASYDFPWVVDDLAVYRRTFRLPECGEQDGCLQVLEVSATGAAGDAAWAQGTAAFRGLQARAADEYHRQNPPVEQAQMLQGASAVCPECRLALVVAQSEDTSHLVAAFRRAQALEPDVVVTNLTAGITPDGSNAPLEDLALYEGAVVVAGGGFSGHSTGIGEAPRRLSNVISVGGTVVDAGRVVSHADNASFCDTSAPQPSWQADFDTGCRGRAGMDVVAPAGKTTGLAVYISGGLPGGRGWYHPGHATQAVSVFGGLLARHGLAREIQGPADLYRHPEWFADITLGSTDCIQQGCSYNPAPAAGECAPLARQVCTARRGWDGASGLGEPRYLPWR